MRKKKVSKILRVKKTNRIVLGEGYIMSRNVDFIDHYILTDIPLLSSIGEQIYIGADKVLPRVIKFPEGISGRAGEKPKKIRLIAEVLE